MKSDTVNMQPIGYVHTKAASVPRFYSISDIAGELIIDEEYSAGLCDVEPGSYITVVFYFHKSPQFEAEHLRVVPPSRNDFRGIFSTRSPLRPNPIGISKLRVTAVHANIISVVGLDMLDETPILDIKPAK